MDSDARVLRGVSIGTTVLQGLAVFFSIAAIIFLTLMSSMLSDPAVLDQVVSELESGGSSAFDGESYYYGDEYDFSGITTDEVSAAAGMGIGVMVALGVGYVVLNGLGLAAGIMGIRNAANPQKAGSVFVWSIIGAVGCLLTGSIIGMALLIVMAVFSNRLKKAAGLGYQPQQPVQAVPTVFPPQGTQAPQPGQPATPPVQPAAPTQVPGVSAQPSAAPDQVVTALQQSSTPAQGFVSAQPVGGEQPATSAQLAPNDQSVAPVQSDQSQADTTNNSNQK